MNWRLLIPFRRDSERAQKASAPRRALFWAFFAVYLAAVAVWFTVLPGAWIWVVFAVDFIAFTILSNRWADKDALALARP